MKPKSDIARPGVVPGEILTLSDFCYRLKLGRHGWSATGDKGRARDLF